VPVKSPFVPLSFKYLRADLAGGVTTAIVSLPLSLSFGVASGAGPQAGLYGAVFVGLFAALFGSSTRLISEPTGPMTVIMTAVLTSLAGEHPDQALAMAFTVVMVAGCFQILLGVLKLGQFITLMPYSVISGFMSGIGVILILIQLPPLLGFRTPPGGVLPVLRELPEMLMQRNGMEVLFGAVSLLILLVYPLKLRRWIPPPLFVLLVGTIASLVFLADAETIRRIGVIPTGLPSLHLPTFTEAQMVRILLDGLVLGVLGCIDTLLTAMIADSLTRSQHDSNKELVGQGIANIFSGLFGGLPGAGATTGTVVNIQTGAQTPLAGILRALILLVFAVWAAPVASSIPMCILAAIAIKVGIDILDWSFLKKVHRVSRTSTVIMYSVLFLTIFVDLIVAVGVGVFVANLLTIQRLSEHQAQDVRVLAIPHDGIRLTAEEHLLLEKAAGRILYFHLSGPVIFGVAKAIAREHKALKGARILIIDLADVPLLGVTLCLALKNLAIDTTSHNASVLVVGAQNETHRRLKELGLFELPGVTPYPDRPSALAEAVRMLEQAEPVRT